jgi:hypothetical protein
VTAALHNRQVARAFANAQRAVGSSAKTVCCAKGLFVAAS